jgi:hypothetical protein
VCQALLESHIDERSQGSFQWYSCVDQYCPMMDRGSLLARDPSPRRDRTLRGKSGSTLPPSCSLQSFILYELQGYSIAFEAVSITSSSAEVSSLMIEARVARSRASRAKASSLSSPFACQGATHAGGQGQTEGQSGPRERHGGELGARCGGGDWGPVSSRDDDRAGKWRGSLLVMCNGRPGLCA